MKSWGLLMIGAFAMGAEGAIPEPCEQISARLAVEFLTRVGEVGDRNIATSAVERVLAKGAFTKFVEPATIDEFRDGILVDLKERYGLDLEGVEMQTRQDAKGYFQRLAGFLGAIEEIAKSDRISLLRQRAFDLRLLATPAGAENRFNVVYQLTVQDRVQQTDLTSGQPFLAQILINDAVRVNTDGSIAAGSFVVGLAVGSESNVLLRPNETPMSLATFATPEARSKVSELFRRALTSRNERGCRN